MDALAALRLQVEWGVDEALDDAPVDRFAPAAAVPADAALRPSARSRPAILGAAPPPEPPGPAAPADVAVPALSDLVALHAALDSFQGCALRATASHTVAPSGNPNAGLVFLAEAPAADDDRSGQAFSGALGHVVNRVLSSAGLDRGAALLTFLVPWRPPGGRQVNETEVTQCLPFVQRLLAITRPRRLVLLGGWPLRALAGDAGGIRQARGRWIEVPIPGAQPAQALPMLPVDTWLKTAATRQNTWADLLMLTAM